MTVSVEDESFMVACLSMANTYLGYVRAELRLYRSRQGHKPLESNFDALTAALEERIKLHRSRLNPPAPPKVQLKKPLQVPEKSLPVRQTAAKPLRKKLKRRVV